MAAVNRFSMFFSRLWSSKIGVEQLMYDILSKRFPQSAVKVDDISGGCGALFEVFVESAEFKGLPILKQHKIITEVLKDQIKDMHGVRIFTAIPKK